MYHNRKIYIYEKPEKPEKPEMYHNFTAEATQLFGGGSCALRRFKPAARGQPCGSCLTPLEGGQFLGALALMAREHLSELYLWCRYSEAVFFSTQKRLPLCMVQVLYMNVIGSHSSLVFAVFRLTPAKKDAVPSAQAVVTPGSSRTSSP